MTTKNIEQWRNGLLLSQTPTAIKQRENRAKRKLQTDEIKVAGKERAEFLKNFKENMKKVIEADQEIIKQMESEGKVCLTFILKKQVIKLPFTGLSKPVGNSIPKYEEYKAKNQKLHDYKTYYNPTR